MNYISKLKNSIKFDLNYLRSKTSLFFFNLLPDIYTMKEFSNLFIYLSGCKIKIRSSYIRKKIHIDSPKNVSIGENFFCNKGLFIEGNGKVIIGNNVQIGPNNQILTTNHTQRKDSELKDVVIGNNVWIGAGVIITPGVNVCDNASIAAGSVLGSDINEEGLWLGVPARKKQ